MGIGAAAGDDDDDDDDDDADDDATAAAAAAVADDDTLITDASHRHWFPLKQTPGPIEPGISGYTSR